MGRSYMFTPKISKKKIFDDNKAFIGLHDHGKIILKTKNPKSACLDS